MTQPGIPFDRPEPHRRLLALQRAAERGWFEYLRLVGDAYVVVIGGVERRLRAEQVLPWVEGVANAHGEFAAFTYLNSAEDAA